MRRFALIGLIVAALSTSAAHGLEAPWGLVQTGDGTLYVVAGGIRHRITPVTIPDDLIAAIPEGDAWEQGRSPGRRQDGPDIHADVGPAAGPDAGERRDRGRRQRHRPSRLFHLSGGNYLIKWTATPTSAVECYQSGVLQAHDQSTPQQSIVNELVEVGARRSGETRVFVLKPGDYRVSMTSGCAWRVTIIPQP